MSEREKIAKALNEALGPLGYRLRDNDGVPVLVEPLHDLFKVYIEAVPEKPDAA